MKILLVTATSFEASALRANMELIKEHNATLASYTYGKHQLDVLVSGVGMVPTAYWMGITLAGRKYDFCLNIGLAGSFSSKLGICELVNVVSDEFSELGAESGDGLLSLVDLGLMKGNTGPFSNLKLLNTSGSGSVFVDGLKQVKGITVNTVHGRKDTIATVEKRFHPDVETMEGAAFLFACLNNDIQCLQLRAISNYVEERNTDKWDIAGSVKALNEAVLIFLNEI